MKRQKPKPAAFMSYARSDDDRSRRLTQFREDLSAEVQRQIGEEFSIFQDREDIRWGQNWKKRIEESIDEVTFLIPIITPSFFRSMYCRDELQQFIEHEKKLERNDLILPVYYVSCDADTWVGDNLAQVIAEHACADWRKLRSKSVDSEEVHNALIERAEHIRDAWKHVQTSEKREVPEPDAGVTRRPVKDVSFTSLLIGKTLEKLEAQILDAQGSVQASEKREAPETDAGVTRRPSSKTEPPIRVVDQMHRGDHVTITEAIEAANPGDRILVRPGLYHEGLVIEKPLEIIGDGNLDDVVLHAVGKNVLLFKTTMGRVTNLTLRQMGGGDWCGVEIAQGRLDLEECDITSQSMACVAIHSGADPRLRRNRIHDGKIGVLVTGNGQGVLEDNDIFGNPFIGVGITGGGNPTLRRNRIHDSKGDGVLVRDKGRGTLEDNDIFGNPQAGVAIIEGGNPTLRRNRINKNGYWAVWVYAGGGGTIEDNDLSGNVKGAWHISADSKPNLRRARNKE
ncbi:MAG: right-handed parallel beta-helix repeat-containing protein [Euryarchaeota archaeon]|nr:right-handed parallel beta-helix repeat-containing protein [Euryarchaeota archaeon]